jgi:signal peptidase (SPase) II
MGDRSELHQSYAERSLLLRCRRNEHQAGLLRCPVKLLVHIGIPQDCLHVLPRFGERNGLHKFRFLLFYIRQYQWPVFNLADSCIVIGAGLLVLEILFSRAKDDTSARSDEKLLHK